MKKILFLSAAALLTNACSNEQTPTLDSPTTPESSQTTQVVIETPEADAQSCRFCARPSTVAECNVADGIATTLYWNLPEMSGQTIGIFVNDENGVDQPFAEQPANAGSIQTGPWLRPGLQFRLKSATGEVLEEITIKGTAC